ncbi:MAG: nicotinamide-nucleotide amidohydrolase family protein [Candidatus Methanomethylophilaceae archaeon]|nr:nicotinamide-nucleotide amidohydrolase family protein [Candidatus Methanomethylophilaceae archaeon]
MGSETEETGQILRKRRMTLALAESCTGGGLGEMITSVPGSSDFFLGGAIVYSNSAKESVLGVRRSTLERYGAVSAEAASEMAEGARRIFGADIAVAITGIAGPGGATEGKPVGLVYTAVSFRGCTDTREHRFAGDRAGIRRMSAESALLHMRSALDN